MILDLQSKVDALYFVVNGGINNISEEGFKYDFANEEHIQTFLSAVVKEKSIKGKNPAFLRAKYRTRSKTKLNCHKQRVTKGNHKQT